MDRSAARVCAAGDFAGFYRLHVGFVRSLVRGLSVEDALEDVVQETFVTAFRRRASLRADASARAWLATIARRTAHRSRRSWVRRARKHRALQDAGGASRPDASDRLDVSRFVERFLAGLDPGKREVFVLHTLGDLPVPEIARQLGLNANTVYTRIRVARESFRAAATAAGLVDAELLAEARAASRPSEAELRAGWLALLPRLKLGATVTLGGATLWAKIGLGTAVVVGTGVGWAAPPRPPAAERSAASLAEQTRLLERVVTSLTDRPAEALRLVHEHRARYPGSPLSEAADVLEIRALCRLERRRELASAVGRFERVHPGSAFAPTSEPSCGSEPGR